MASKQQIEEVARELYIMRPLVRQHTSKAVYCEERLKWLDVVFKMQDTFAASNPKFDRNNFQKACGVGSGE